MRINSKGQVTIPQEIREKAGLAYSVDCDCVPFSNTGVFTVYSAMAPRSLPKCLGIIAKEIESLVTKPLTEKEISIVKGQLKGTILLSNDQMETRQESLGRNEVVFDRYVSVEEVIEEIDRVSPTSIQALAQRIFVKEKESVVAICKTRPPRASMSLF